MPYIDKESRHFLTVPRSSGELNYLITKELDRYINRVGLSYTTLNICIGVLECAKLELYRRIAAPYEDKKCEENGDVYNI